MAYNHFKINIDGDFADEISESYFVHNEEIVNISATRFDLYVEGVYDTCKIIDNCLYIDGDKIIDFTNQTKK